MSKIIKSLYGHVMLPRGFCPNCKKYSIILDKKYQCCNKEIETTKKEIVKRIVEGETKRTRLGTVEKKEIIENQNNKCFYCGCDLDNSWYIKKHMKNPKRITIHFDHVIPWAYSRATVKYGMVATCNICNSLKSSKYFENEMEAREYIMQKRDKKGIIVL